MNGRLRHGFAREAETCLIVAFALSCVAGAALTARGEDGGPQPVEAQKDPGDPRRELEELGTTLKAAVMSGTLTEKKAREIYKVAAARLRERVKTSSDGKDVQAAEEARREAEEVSPKQSVLRLSTPKPMQVSALFRPEFLTRDLAILHADLDLDRNQMMIAGLLVHDYLDAMDLASLPLREALRRYRGTIRNQWLTAAVERAQRMDPEVAVERTREVLERIAREYREKIESGGEEGHAKFEGWSQRIIEVTSQLDARLASLRHRMAAGLSALDRQVATLTAEGLVRMAKQLRAERTRLREQMTEDLEIILTEEQRGEGNVRFEASITVLRISHLLPHGRLGGESMNLWAALTETDRDRRPAATPPAGLESVEVMLRQRAVRIVQKLDGRMEATLDRKISGLEFQAERERIAAASGASVFEVDERRLVSARRPYAEAARRELNASVAVRDAMLDLLDEASASMEELYPDSGLSDTYRKASLRRGFPIAMRQRWAERSLATALDLDGLQDDTREALLAAEAANRNELAAVRADAIAKRVTRDPQLAREFIDAALVGGGKEVEWIPEMWLGINYETFDSIDDRTERQLRAMLTPEQVERLPVREGANRRAQKKE